MGALGRKLAQGFTGSHGATENFFNSDIYLIEFRHWIPGADATFEEHSANDKTVHFTHCLLLGDGPMTGLRVAFAGGNGYPPEAQGGVQSSTHDLALRLMDIGGVPSVLAPLYGDGLFGLAARARLKLVKTGLARDRSRGYPVYRAWFPKNVVPAFVAKERPDCAVVQCHGTVPLARTFLDADVPVIVYLRNVEFHELQGDPTTLEGVTFIANSRFTAERYRQNFGIDAAVIPPTLDPSLYRTQVKGEYVTFINPVEEKGLEKALAIAALCPDIPFLFCESWQLAPNDLDALRRSIAPYRNIRLQRRVEDIREVYSKTRLLLAPSKWAEAWGRVASEAHVNGIPVIGSDRGGLPEAIGPGGRVLSYDAPTHEWASAVRDIWIDDKTRNTLASRARTYASRPEMDGAHQFETFLSLVEQTTQMKTAA